MGSRSPAHANCNVSVGAARGWVLVGADVGGGGGCGCVGAWVPVSAGLGMWVRVCGCVGVWVWVCGVLCGLLLLDERPVGDCQRCSYYNLRLRHAKWQITVKNHCQ